MNINQDWRISSPRVEVIIIIKLFLDCECRKLCSTKFSLLVNVRYQSLTRNTYKLIFHGMAFSIRITLLLIFDVYNWLTMKLKVSPQVMVQ